MLCHPHAISAWVKCLALGWPAAPKGPATRIANNIIFTHWLPPKKTLPQQSEEEVILDFFIFYFVLDSLEISHEHQPSLEMTDMWPQNQVSTLKDQMIDWSIDSVVYLVDLVDIFPVSNYNFLCNQLWYSHLYLCLVKNIVCSI